MAEPSATHPGRGCPHCAAPLSGVASGSPGEWTCTRCAGHYLDGAATRALVVTVLGIEEEAMRELPAEHDGIGPLPCPCGAADASSRLLRSVAVSACPACGGLWLRAGVLARLSAGRRAPSGCSRDGRGAPTAERSIARAEQRPGAPDAEVDRHARLSSILLAALALPDGARAAHVAGACADDEELRAEVEALLARAGGGLPDWVPALDPTCILSPAEPVAQEGEPQVHVGGYRVVRVIGQGGMGTVYEAEQATPRRRVALKVIRGWGPGVDALRRFEREAHVLGRLQHPGICHVYEVGRTASGDPFIAMEHVDGLPLLEYADAAGLGRAERLALACRICDALAHAHERGIVHRDLKPDNILITRDGQPKIVDFGIARAAELTVGSTLLTSAGAVVGTVAYMSPEQASGRSDVDARSDIFSLGVVLFELLTRRRPASIEGLSLPQALHVIQQAEYSLSGQSDDTLRGDIGTILGKALEREPSRRYDSARAFAADIRRHLSHEPIVARPPSVAYRMTKFTQRHRTMVAAASLVVLALAAAAALSLRAARTAESERQLAVVRADLAERESYKSRLTAAFVAMERGDYVAAAGQLAAAPEGRRGWEMTALEAITHQQFGRVLLDAPVRGIVLSADGAVAMTVRRDGGREEIVRVARESGVLLSSHSLDARPVVVPREARVIAIASVADRARDTRPVDIIAAEDGSALATVRPCDIAFGDEPGPLEAISADGRHAVMRDAEGRGVTCDLASGLHQPHRFGLGVGGVVYPDGRHVASADIVNVRVVDTLTGRIAWSTPPSIDAGWSVGLDPDGRCLYTCGLNIEPILSKYDAATGRLLARRRVDARGAGGWAFSPDGRHVACVHDGGGIDIFTTDLDSEPTRLAVPRRGPLDVLLHPDGRHVLAASPTAGLREWDRGEAPVRSRVRMHGSYVYDVRFAPDGVRLASASWDGTVKIWDPRTAGADTVLTAPVKDRADAVSWLHDGSGIVAITGAGLCRIDAATGRTSVVRDGVGMGAVDCSPTRDVVAVGHEGGSFILDAASLTPLREMPACKAMRWSPDGARLAVAALSPAVGVLDGDTLEPVWTKSLGSPAREVAWSRDGLRLAMIGEDGLLIVDSATGTSLVSGREASDAWALAWSGAGRRIVTGDAEGVLKSWDSATGELVVALPFHDAYVRALEFSPDGTTLVTASGDGTVGVWRSEDTDGHVARPGSPGP